MCIIAVKPKGVKITDQIMNVLENCWIWNPDGAGLMTPSANGISISKGFMDWDDLEQYLEVYNEELSDSQVVFHFRWATHGLTNQENCHPFPITSDIDLLTSLEVDSKIGMVHNGIIDQAPASKHHSDTLLFTRDYLSSLGDKVFDRKVANFIAKMTGSKFVFMSADKMVMAGHFEQAHGMFFSNDGYKVPSKFMGSFAGNADMLDDGDSCKKDDAFGSVKFGESCAFCNGELEWYEGDVCVECEDKYAVVGTRVFDDIPDDEDFTHAIYDPNVQTYYLEDGTEVML